MHPAPFKQFAVNLIQSEIYKPTYIKQATKRLLTAKTAQNENRFFSHPQETA